MTLYRHSTLNGKILSIATAIAISATAVLTTVPPTIAEEKATSSETFELAQNKTAAEKREMKRLEREKRRQERAKERKNRRGGIFGGSFS